MAEEPDLLDLEDVREEDRLLVGSKALNLGLMMKAGLPVPRGFIVTTHAYKMWRRSPQARLPKPIQERILEAYRTRGFRRVAVRSSAILEDLPHASFAGIYTSRFNVGSEEELLEAVEECFRSLKTPRSDLYRRSLGLKADGKNLGMAVLVQEMIPASASGVMYTVDPITLDRQVFSINAVFGLGEPLVSGRVLGDIFRVDRSGRGLEQRLSEKASMLTLDGKIAIPDDRRTLPSLTPGEIRTLVEKGVTIEKLFGTPQDIEFAVAHGEISILQARPVPIGREPLELKLERYRRQEIEGLKGRIAELRRKRRLTTSEAVFSSGNIAELLPTPTPMSFGIFTSIFAEEGGIQIGRRRLGYVLNDETSEGLFTLIGGHPYFNLEIDARTFHIGVPLNLQSYIDQVKQDPGLANYPELGLYQQSWTLEEAIARFGRREGRKYYKRFLTFLGGMKKHGREYLPQFHREVEPRLQRDWERERHVDLVKFSNWELVDKIRAYLEHLRIFSSVHFVIAARLGFFFTERVKRKLHEWFPGEAEALVGELLRGLEQSRIGQMAWDLARLARSEISRERFLAMYGHLATNELEISLPRLADDPRVLEHLMKGSGKDPRTEFEEQVERRLRAEEKIRRQLKRARVKSPVLQELFEELEYAQTYLPLRETIKYYIAAEYALIRKALLILAERLDLHHEEIFSLYPAEIPELLSDLEKAREKAEQRKEERQLALLLSKQKRMPKVIFEGSLEAIGAPPKIEASQEFTGIPVSSGEAAGTARTLDPEEPDLLKAMDRWGDAEVIVTRAANLGMATLVRKAAGLILETGGLLAHGACLARERGIPAVVLANATALLPDGSPVKIDGNSGKVYLLT